MPRPTQNPIRRSLLAAVALAAGLPALALAAEVNIYSSRGEALIKPLLDRFSEQTGTTVRLVTGKPKALIQRLQAEGRNSPADLLLTVDAGNLVAASRAGLLQGVSDETLETRVPAELRDPDGQWFALSRRARVFVLSPERTADGAPARYEDLADPAWRGRLCIRSSSNIYNQSLMASLISHNGAQAAADWASATRANMARKPQGNDRSQIAAVAAGECDVALVNSYYLGMMSKGSDDERAAAAQVKLVYPNQGADDRGAHVNISGVGLSANAPNRETAVALMQFLVSEASQRWYADTNNEYPVSEGVAMSDTVASWGPFKADALPVVTLGALNRDAVKTFDRSGWE